MENIYECILGLSNIEYSEPNFYELLGVAESVDSCTIEKAFRTQMLKLQEKANNPKYKDVVLFLKGKLRSAHQVLMDVKSRQAYNKKLLHQRWEIWERDCHLLQKKGFLLAQEKQYLEDYGHSLQLSDKKMKDFLLSIQCFFNMDTQYIKKNNKRRRFFFCFLTIVWIIVIVQYVDVFFENKNLQQQWQDWQQKYGILLQQMNKEKNKGKKVAKKEKLPEFVERLSHLVYVPAGSFIMGSEDQEDTQPVRQIELDAFYISRYEVTNKEYAIFIQETGHAVPYQPGEEALSFTWNPLKKTHPDNWENKPVVLVTWDDANAYCAWLSKKWHWHVSLPTEAQWEKAARGYFGNRFVWGNEFPTAHVSNIGNATMSLSDVGMYEKDVSPFGCYDMTGNVGEWCLDAYSRDAYKYTTKKNPCIIDNQNIWGVVRGGNWTMPSFSFCSTTYRQVIPKKSKSIRWGFRYVVAINKK
ncbi:MAG TPA: SUMF1/EgtB/PvdO family nonheme iron enzyme [Planctomycetota bacterium]|nr:SUMF1/EgtB/PvdO family nonheme iron enzyme [Planctomycetota bacterium]HQB00842.1 SUMF1/EgtB/PvdO family nonheme iron enzyme [Planctomycetota bacterium]